MHFLRILSLNLIIALLFPQISSSQDADTQDLNVLLEQNSQQTQPNINDLDLQEILENIDKMQSLTDQIEKQYWSNTWPSILIWRSLCARRHVPSYS